VPGLKAVLCSFESRIQPDHMHVIVPRGRPLFGSHVHPLYRTGRRFTAQTGPLWGPSSLLINAYRRLSARRYRPRANHSPPPIADVVKGWRYTSIPPTCLQGMHTYNFYWPLCANSRSKKGPVSLYMSQHVETGQGNP
jgi:hypothetical protein